MLDLERVLRKLGSVEVDHASVMRPAAGTEDASSKEAQQAQKRLLKRQKAQAKRLAKLRLEGVLLDRSSQKGATIVSTLVPFAGRGAQHQKRPEDITSTVVPAVNCDGTCGVEGGSGCSCASSAGEWLVETVVKHPTDDHLDYFWHRSQLVGMGRDMFPNIKEITESTGAYLAAVRYMEENALPCHASGSLAVVCVADGGSPRTASLFATYLPQEVHSVDPAMHARYTVEDAVPAEFLPAKKKGTLSAHACTIEEWVRRMPPPSPALVCVCVVAVHSHALLEDYVPQVRRHYAQCRVILLAVPCCVEQRLCPPLGAPTSKGLHPSLQPAHEFSDMAIHSHDRAVRIWDLPAVASLPGEVAGSEAADALLYVSMRTHTDKAKKGNHVTNGGRHRLISDMYGQHH